jgi:hypothetical protein
MYLKEFIYFDKDDADFRDDNRYDPGADKKVLKLSDVRKTQLRLKDINKLRKAGEAHDEELDEESELIQAQYAVPVQPPQ